MQNSWVMLKRDSNEWILITASLLVATMAVFEVIHPGTIGSILSGFLTAAHSNVRFW